MAEIENLESNANVKAANCPTAPKLKKVTSIFKEPNVFYIVIH